MDALTDEIKKAAVTRNAFAELISYRAAFQTLYNLSEVLNLRLTQEVAKKLSTDTDKFKAVVTKMLKSKQLNLTKAEHESLATLQDFIAGVEHPDKLPKNWQNRKIADFFNREDQKLIEKLKAKAALSKTDARNLKKYTTRTLHLCQDLETVSLLLKQWIPEKDLKAFKAIMVECQKKESDN